MIEGPSKLLACSPPWALPTFRSERGGGCGHARMAERGCREEIFGVDRPCESCRGPAMLSASGHDEAAAWGPNGKETFEQLLLGFRMLAPDGSGPRGVISTTPLDNEVIRWFIAGAYGERKVSIAFSRSTTDDNASSLAPSLFRTLVEYAGNGRGATGTLWHLRIRQRRQGVRRCRLLTLLRSASALFLLTCAHDRRMGGPCHVVGGA